MVDDNDVYFSKTLEKGLILLSLFDRDHTSRRLTEISKITRINKTSVYRFVNTLVKLGYLRKSKKNNLIRLGPESFVLGHNFFHGFDMLQSVKPIIEKTFLEHKISIDSAILHGHTLISLHRREVPNIIFKRLPLVMKDLHARAMGKAILANMNNEDLSAYLDQVKFKKLTPNTIDNPKALIKDLKLSKERGYSINNEEYVNGLICIGAPIINFNTNQIMGAVSLDFPSSEYSLESIECSYTGILTKLANELSEAITSVNI
jgi:IclR family pca regulon transcriptional regulator